MRLHTLTRAWCQANLKTATWTSMSVDLNDDDDDDDVI